MTQTARPDGSSGSSKAGTRIGSGPANGAGSRTGTEADTGTGTAAGAATEPGTGDGPGGRTGPPTVKYLKAGTLGLTTAAAIVTSLRGLPMMAEEELTMFAYIAFSVVLFLIPAGLVAAELGSAFGTKAGGLYAWISAAFGKKTGFAVIFLSWIQVLVFYPTGLTFAGAAIAFAIDKPELASNHTYIGIFAIVAFWVCTLAALVSNQFAAKVTQAGFLLGTAVPGIVLIAAFIWWISSGQSIGWEHTTDAAVTAVHGGHAEPRMFPHIVGLSGLAFLAGILLNFAGIESQAVHASELRKPGRQYPIVIAIAATISFGIFTLGALAIAGILPFKDIDLNTGVFDAFHKAFVEMFGSPWPVYVLAALIAYGALAGILAWITGPSRGVLATAHDGMLPPVLQKVNPRGVQSNILIIQAVVVTMLCCVYFVIKDVNTAFFLISAMAVSLYIIIYLFMYAAAIRLRRTQPDLPRPFKIPGGKVGMWAVAGTGFTAVAFAFVLAFVPPSQLPIGNPATYVLMVAGGAIVFCVIPLIIERLKKPSWLPPEDVRKRALGPSGEHEPISERTGS